MKKLGGNTTLLIRKSTTTLNEIGEPESTWEDALTLKGWLDMMSGTSTYEQYDAKVAEATHVFMCDYDGADLLEDPVDLAAFIGDKYYAVLYVDNPVGLNRMTEIYLKRVALHDDETDGQHTDRSEDLK